MLPKTWINEILQSSNEFMALSETSAVTTIKYVSSTALLGYASYRLWLWYNCKPPNTITRKAYRNEEPLDEFCGVLKLLPNRYDVRTFNNQEETIAVYITLKGPLLEVYEARETIPMRELFNEGRLELTFTRLRVYNISGCSVSILPRKIDKMFYWEHQYPIEITLKEDSLIEEVIFEGMSPRINGDKLILFARSDRDKEAWMRRIVSSTKKNKLPSRTQDPVMSINTANPYKTPPHYIYRRTQGVWLNSLLNRVLADENTKDIIEATLTLQVQELLDNLKIGDKIETLFRLTVFKIDLENFGIPKIIGVAAPYENDLGLWEEILLKYDGLLKIIVEVKLNPQTFGENDERRPMNQNYEDTPWVSRLGFVSYLPFMANMFKRTTFYIEINLDLLSGGMAINIPKAPTEFAWIGFREETKLDLSGTFYWGSWRMPFLYQIIDEINATLLASFQRDFIIPNMMQIHLPMWTK